MVSACLAGIRCSFDGKNRLNKYAKRLHMHGDALAVCPEVLGSLPVPRQRSEITGGSGKDVLDNKARVITLKGTDVTGNFIKGARSALKLAKKHKIKKAILKSKSPSCGPGVIYDGTFSGILKKGDGVLAAVLRQNKIMIYDEKSLKNIAERCRISA